MQKHKTQIPELLFTIHHSEYDFPFLASTEEAELLQSRLFSIQKQFPKHPILCF